MTIFAGMAAGVFALLCAWMAMEFTGEGVTDGKRYLVLLGGLYGFCSAVFVALFIVVVWP